MAIQFSNLASTTLASGVSSSATSVSVTSASLFPSLGGSDYFYATLGDDAGSEIVKVTAISGTTFTVVRGQDGTSAISHSVGTHFALRVTAAALEDLRDSPNVESVSKSGDTMTGALLGTTASFSGSVTAASVVVSGNVDGRDVATDGTKLDGIEASATADQTNAEIRTAVEAASDSNVFTDADHTKLNAIEASATADQTGAQIKTAYEAETNAFTDAQFTKLSGIETSADATDTDNVVASLSAGSGISLSVGGSIANTSPDQTVALTGAGTTSVSGTYPNFTITGGGGSTYTVGSGLSLTGTEFANTAPDQTVALTEAGATSISGTYPNFTISSVNTTYSVGDGGLSQNNFTNADHSKLDGIAASANNYVLPSGYATETYVGTQISNLVDSSPAALNTLNELAAALGDDANFSTTITTSIGTKLPLAGGALTGAVTTNSTFDGRDVSVDGTKLDGIETGATTDQTAAEIRALVESATDSNVFANADHTKLDGIETGATADQTGAQIKTAYEAETNAFTDAQFTKLSGIEASATADQTAAQIKTAYESNANTQAFTDADHTKLDGIEASADVTDTGNVVASLTAGSGISLSAGGVIASTSSYSLPVATNTVLGGVKLFSNTDQSVAANSVTTTASRTYGVQLNSADQTVVNVPWVNTTYSVGDGGLSQINFTSADHTKLNGIATGANNYSFPYTVSASAGNSTVVQRHGSGYIYANYFNTSPNTVTSGVTQVCVETGNDGFIRHGTAAAIRTFLNVANGATNTSAPYYTSAIAVGAGGLTQQNFTTTLKSKLDGIATSANNYSFPYTIATASTANTVALRDSAGDINARLFRSEYDSTNASCNYFMTQVDTASNNYMRPSTPAQVRTSLNVENGATADQTAAQILTAVKTVDGSGSGLDADTVDGIQGASFLRSDATDYQNNTIYQRGYLVNETGYRDRGVYGHYDSNKTNHIWSMGVAYKNNAAGTNFGSLYGLAYKHTNNATGGSMAGGHQMVWCQNGTGYAAMGSNIWTSGNVTAYSDIRVKENLKVIPNALDKVMQLNGYTYDRTDLSPATTEEEDITYAHNPTGRHVGVIAQEVLKVLPEAVTGGPNSMDGTDDDHYSVAYGNMVALLIESIKELKSEVDSLKEQLNSEAK